MNEANIIELPDIHLRDPFVLWDSRTDRYLMTGTKPDKLGFPLFSSYDLRHWIRLNDAFVPSAGFWGSRDFWAPEIHEWAGAWFLFGSFSAEGYSRATHILTASRPEGPYQPLTERPITPEGWECLDGTFYVENGQPWVIFCREWTEVGDGRMCAMRLSHDLTQPTGEPIDLFRATEAPWVRPVDTTYIPGEFLEPCYVTDGPWLHRTGDGSLWMLWSSFGEEGYALGLACSEGGGISGPWRQQPALLFAADGGHAMIFRDREKRALLCLHQPNRSPDERPHFFPFDMFAERMDGVRCAG